MKRLPQKWPAAAFLGLVLSLAFVIDILPKMPILRNPTPILPQANTQLIAKFGIPVRLTIPAINVDAAIEQVGLTSDGVMDAPKTPEGLAWYKLGSRPGENGSAVIAGHYGPWKNGDTSVFDKLYRLSVGDKVYVEDNKGVVTSFVVRESRRYDPDADASSVFSSKEREPRLNLITCDGAWNKTSKSYPLRLVVFTDKE